MADMEPENVISELAGKNLITATTAGDYLAKNLQTSLSTGQQAALQALTVLSRDGNVVDLSLLTQLKIYFQAGQPVIIQPQQLAKLILKPDASTNSAHEINGFELIIDLTLKKHQAEFENNLNQLTHLQNITRLELFGQRKRVNYSVNWSPMSNPAVENVNQHLTKLDRAVFIYALPKTKYSMRTAVAAARYPRNFEQLIAEFHARNPERALPEIRRVFMTQLSEMLKEATLKRETKPKFELLVDKSKARSDKEFYDNWDPVLFDPRSGEKYAGINMKSYESLMAMSVRIPHGPFWQGFTWLLWEISWFGILTEPRQKAIDKAEQSLQNQLEEIKHFDDATNRMKRFIDWYVKQHISDPNLPDFVAKYWPLTTGRREPLIAGEPDVVITEQDPKLLNEFMANYGAEYYRVTG